MTLHRLDTIVADKTETSRSYAAKLIQEGKVRLGNEVLDKPSKKISSDTNLKIEFNKNIVYPALDIEVIYEDANCIVINKPSGVLTHSKGAFNPEATVATWLHDKVKSLEKSDQRSGIVHRLDRGTSGVIILAKSDEAQKHLQKQFSQRKVKKTYIALIEGAISPSEALVDIPIIRNSADPKRFKVSKYGKSAQTQYRMIKSFMRSGKKYSLVELSPKTGRTHQIRLHLRYMNFPIVGDDFYDGVKADRLYLHAEKLELTLPDSSRKVFEAPLPKKFIKPRIY